MLFYSGTWVGSLKLSCLFPMLDWPKFVVVAFLLLFVIEIYEVSGYYILLLK